MEDKDHTGAIIGTIISVFLLLLCFFGSWFTVSPGEKGVVLRFGTIRYLADNGFHFKMPFIDSVVKMDVQTQKEQTTAEAASSDLQTVSTVVAVNYQLDGAKIVNLYTSIGEEYKEKVIDPAIQEAVKAATAKYTAEELITKRPQVQDDIHASLVARLTQADIIVGPVSIINFDFSKTFNEAIEAKVTAEQNALAAKNKLDQVKYEAEQKIATAKADAEAIRIQTEAIQNGGGQSYVALQSIKVQQSAVEKWDGHLPTQMIPNGAVPFLNLTK